MMCCALKAQQKHFIYVQSEDKQPFAVVLGGKVFSSSDYGYVIIPKLTDSTYKFTVSFPMNKFPDQSFTCTINKKDVGYALKNETGGWVLENMQTQKLISNGNADVAQKTGFGDMLSDVVSDSTLTTNTAMQKPADTVKTVMDTVAQTQPVNNTVANNTNVSTTDLILQPQKISESKLDTGTNMLFVDKTQNGFDTINVFIPSEAINNNTVADQSSASANTNVATAEIPTTPVNSDVSSKINNEADNTTSADNNQQQDTTNRSVSNPFYKPGQDSNSTTVNTTSTINNTNTPNASVTNGVKQDCSNMISDDDMSKLKRKMFVQKNDNDMVQYAVKYLNKKCITTDQVKLLGDLFSSDDGRYNLYDGLYKYVYDYGNYPTLANQILDPYYKKRFAALLR